MKRFSMILSGCLLLGGCASTHWERVDGAAVSPAQFELDKAACDGQVASAEMPFGRGDDPIVSGIVAGIHDARVQIGCMAQHGYLLAKDQRQ